MDKKDNKIVRVYEEDLKLLDNDPLKLWQDSTIIGEYAFSKLQNLKSITIPSTIKEIESNAFYGCKNLSSVKLSKNLEFIANWAFMSCESLKSVEVSNSTAVSFYAFEKWTNVKRTDEIE